MRSALAWMVWLALAGCGGSATSQTQAAEPRAKHGAEPRAVKVAFRFGWQPGRIAVVERAEKKGVPATLGYTLVVEPHGEELWVNYEDIRFRQIGGHDASEPAVRAEIEAVEKQVRGTPMGMRIDREGNYLGLVDIEAVSETARRLSKKDDDGTFRRALANPRLRAMLEQAAGKPWQAWVSAWNGLSIEPFEVVEGDLEHAITADAKVTEHRRCEHLGSEREHPGSVRLRCEGVIDDPRLGSGLGAMVNEVVPEDEGGAKLGEALKNMKVRVQSTFEVVTVPDGLRPAWARSVEVTTIVLDGHPIEAREVHEWTFSAAAP